MVIHIHTHTHTYMHTHIHTHIFKVSQIYAGFHHTQLDARKPPRESRQNRTKKNKKTSQPESTPDVRMNEPSINNLYHHTPTPENQS